MVSFSRDNTPTHSQLPSVHECSSFEVLQVIPMAWLPSYVSLCVG